ncbi:Fic family protein [Mycolicibacterium aromaticivorans]|uniref:Fic family protein n=1 Tax=Mycolicibacterium aromaticivorans TaxID=318425 RepID=UPI0004BAB048|nr:Fic family protein [Mycolicibacterium aromaticivorans]
MVVVNTAAIQAAVAMSETVDADAIRAMHRALMVNDARHTPGGFRTEPVWIGGGSTPIGATFVGPRHELIPAAIDDLIAYTQRVDVPARPQIAVTRAQFETIHPFTDGTGRALAQALLRNKGLTRQVTVPVSAGLLADTDAYFAALLSYRDGDATPIVQRFSQATVPAIANGRQLVRELREIRENWNGVITARSDSAVWRVADLLTRAQSSTPRCWRGSWAWSPPTLTATSIRSQRRESSSRQPLDPATECGARPKCSPRSMLSPNAPAGEADTREFTSDISGRQGVSSCCFGWCVSCILKPRLRMLIIEAAKHLGRDISDVSMP